MARIDTIEVNGSPMRVSIAAPAGRGPHPGVLVMCHIGGLDAFTEDRDQQLAESGFLAAAPDVFHYHEWFEDRDARRASLRDDRLVDDIEATIDHLVGTAELDPERIAILGHCMGGRVAMLGAGSIARIGPLVVYYGGRSMISWGGEGPTPFERIVNVKGPVIGFFGMDDTEPSPRDVDAIEAEFAQHGIACEFHRYEGAGHAFQNFLGTERYREEAARDAWEKTLHFLGEALR